MKKLALFLALALLLTAALGAEALAAEGKTVASGKFGKLKWKLTELPDEDGEYCGACLLTISGKGRMEDLKWNKTDSCWADPPWVRQDDDDDDGYWIEKVVIKKGVTSIGSGVFADQDDITAVTIPEGVTSIGQYAFSFCSSLEDVTIPKSLKTVGEGAFWECTMLAEDGFIIVSSILFEYVGFSREVTIPEGVTRIEPSAFESNEYVQRVTIPESVRRIGECAFDDCDKLTFIYFAGSREKWEKVKLREDAIPESVSVACADD